VKTEEDQEAILVAVKAIARAWGPISCELTEIGLMSNGSNAEVSNVTCHGGAAFYTDLVNAIEGEFGKFERKYDFLPHVTLRMKNGSRKTVGVDDFVPFSWKANAVTVQFGGEGGPKHEIKLTGKKKG
jgi:2'-5' RNA ligase